MLQSIGSVGDALDNALAESFVDSYKTELIADRVWRSRQHVELETVKWVAWFNHRRLHSSLGDIPPVEFEHNHHVEIALNTLISGDGTLAAISPSAADGLSQRRLTLAGAETVVQGPAGSENGPLDRTLLLTGNTSIRPQTRP